MPQMTCNNSLPDEGIAMSKDWPAQSPDLNIEQIYTELKRVNEKNPYNLEELQVLTHREWHHILGKMKNLYAMK